MGNAHWRAARWVAGTLILFFLGRSVARNWSDIRLADVPWDIRPLSLVLSVVTIWLCFAVLIEAWRVLADGRPTPAPNRWETARIWMVSSMAKYIPGKIWTFAGMAVLARRAGLSPWTAAESSLILQILSIGTGVALLAVSGRDVLAHQRLGQGTLMILLGSSVAGLGALLWPPIAERLSRFAARIIPSDPGSETPPRPKPAALAWGIVANAVAWLGYGLALWLVARGTMPSVTLGLGSAVGAWVASYIGGFLSPIPGGLGIREGILFVLLRPEIGAGPAAGLAAASRLVVTLAEVGAVAPFLLRSREASRRVN